MELNKTYLTENLDQFTTSELKQKLRAEVKKETPSGPLVRSILRILETRKEEYTATSDEEVEAACAQYQAYCGGVEEDIRKKVVGVRRFALKVATVVLIMGMLVFTVPQVVEAGQFQGLFKRWNENVFELFGPLYKGADEIVYVFNTDHPGLQQVYDLVTELGITDPVVPTWLPEGYVLLEIKSTQSPLKHGFCAFFSDGNSMINFSVDIYDPKMAHSYLKNTGSPVTYEYDGIQHDITENDGHIVAIWSRENMGFSMTADCQIEILYRIIDSIYTTEDN